MTEVRWLTCESSYRGEMDLAQPDGTPVRLLDALNNPQRVAPRGGSGRPLVMLRRAMRQGRSGTWSIPCAAETWLDPERILVAYEWPLRSVGGTTSDYERRRSGLYTVRMQLHLEGGYLLEGDVLSRSPGARHLRDRTAFVACTRVRLRDLELAESPIELPFAAVNLDRVESLGVLGVIKNLERPETAFALDSAVLAPGA